METKNQIETDYDLICIGAGIMSATLALMLKLIDRNKKILILEKLDDVAQESTATWNNAGTGHSAFCEMNYTPEGEDGSIDISKAIEVCTQFEKSKQFWSYLLENGFMDNPRDFIHPVPHHSWVKGEEDVEFLKKRYAAMTEHFLFEGMQYSEDIKTMSKWFPLMMQGRQASEKMAATRMELGTEVNFEQLTRKFFAILETKFHTPVHTLHQVKDIDPSPGVDWLVEVKDLQNNSKYYCQAKHVFIGAGGGALPLLQKVEIEQKEGYGGFPVSGEWLICKNRAVIEEHHAKVYSKAGLDAPPMSVPTWIPVM